MSRSEAVRALFEEASELPAEERAAYLAGACPDDAGARAEVQALLEALDGAGGFLEPGPEAPPAPGEHPGARVDRYRLLERIGEGGMGTVWMAEQTEPVRRTVALKLVKLGLDTRQVVARFEAERQALALMDHPGIARVLDGGATADGRPFFAMELVRGAPITEFCDHERLSVRARLELFAQVCHAVQHAHQKGVIHRDLKPSNVLVTLLDGAPVPKVIDFGIAKATDAELTQRTLFTGFRQLVGTPDYMAPEQAVWSAVDVDTRSDVYSLGVLLYELLTGTRPFDSTTLLRGGYEELLRHIREVDPPRPSTRIGALGERLGRVASSRRSEARELGRALRGELDWIVMRALEKDRARRYATASALAADVARHLADEPVEAGPPDVAYRLRKALRRNRGLVLASGLVLSSLMAGLVAAGVALQRAWSAEALARDEAERADAEARKLRAVHRFVQEDLLGAVDPDEAGGREVTVREVLERASRAIAAGAFASAPEVEAEVRGTVGWLSYRVGDVRGSLPHLERSLQLARDLHAGPSLDVAEAARRLGVARARTGDVDGGLELLGEGLELRRGLQGSDDRDTLFAAIELGAFRLQAGDAFGSRALVEGALADGAGRFPDLAASAGEVLAACAYVEGDAVTAVELQRRVLARTVELHGADGLDAAYAATDLGKFLGEVGELDEAAELLERSLAHQRRVLGDHHPRVGAALRALGRVRLRRGELVEAERLLRASIDVRREALGEDNGELAQSLNDLALALLERGDVGAAEGVARDALRALGTGAEARVLAVALVNLGTALDRAGRAEAEEALRRSLELHLELHGDDDAATAHVRTALARHLSSRGLHEEALEQALAALETLRRLAGDDAEAVAVARHHLGAILAQAGRHEEAERELRAALEANRGVRPARAAENLYGLGRILDSRGESARAVALLAEAMETLRGLGGEDGAERAAMEVHYGKALRRAGELDEAEAVLEGALDVQRALGSGPGLAEALMELAKVRLSRDRPEEAERLLRECLELRRAFQPGHPLVFETVSGLGAALIREERFAEAEALLLEHVDQVAASGHGPAVEATLARRLARLYEAWDAAEPGAGHAARAERWTRALEGDSDP